MIKKTLILFGVLAGFLLLIVGNIFKAGSGHVEVVEKVEVLQDENQKLSSENKHLNHENKKLKVAKDSLITHQDSLKETVETLSSEVNKYETTLQKIKSAPTKHDNHVVADKPYNIIVPIETEAEIPGSEN